MRPGRVRTGWREPTAGVSLVAGQVAEGGVRKPVPVMSSITGSPAAADMGIQRRNPFKKISSANAPPHVPAALAALSPLALWVERSSHSAPLPSRALPSWKNKKD